MEEQAYVDTIESLHTANEVLSRENENYKLANIIRQAKGLKKQKQKGAYFTKVYLTATKQLIKVIDSSEQALLFCLIPYLDYESNFVVDNDGQYHNILQIAKIIGKSKRHTERLLDSLEEKGVLTKVPNGRVTNIQLNSKYFYRGQ